MVYTTGMDVLSVGGKEYVKASVIAKDLGYTADYVGQLCRSHRVHAKLVGRSWYVDRDSIHVHKGNRYRTNHAKTKESFKEDVRVHVSTRDEAQSQSRFYAHTTPQSKKISYETDDAELIPVVGEVHTKKRSLVKVGLADAVPVSVVSREKGYKMDAPALPEIKFSGTLHVEDIEDAASPNIGSGTHVIHPKNGDLKKGSKNIVISDVPLKIAEEQAPEVASKKHSSHVTRSHTKHVEVTEESNNIVQNSVIVSPVAVERLSASLLVTTFLFSLVVAGAMLGLQANIAVVEGSMSTSYLFEVGHLTASAYAAAEDTRAIFDLFKFSTNFFIF